MRNKSNVPVYVIRETPEDFKIAYDMSNDGRADMELLLSEDKRRLHVLGKTLAADYVDEFLWIFELPKSADAARIGMIHQDDLYLIQIPKKKFSYRFHTPPQFASAI